MKYLGERRQSVTVVVQSQGEGVPQFLGIGAQKSGTTWLHQVLSRHPDIWLPPEKELHFFDERRYQDSSGPISRLQGSSAASLRWRRQILRQWKRVKSRDVSKEELRWYVQYFGRKSDVRWYRALFNPAGKRVCGEVTPDYSKLEEDEVVWAYEAIGQTKIIFFVRNPIERVWSQAQMVQRMQGRPAEEVVEGLLQSQSAQALSAYGTTIERWSSVFGQQDFFLGQMEDIALAPRRLVDAVVSFLGLPPPPSYPGASRVVHRGGHDEMTTSVAQRLAEHFVEPLEALADSVGGWTRWWHFCARELLEDPPENEVLPYPLWESELWDRWQSSTFSGVVQPLRSGSLPQAYRWATQEQQAVET